MSECMSSVEVSVNSARLGYQIECMSSVEVSVNSARLGCQSVCLV